MFLEKLKAFKISLIKYSLFFTFHTIKPSFHHLFVQPLLQKGKEYKKIMFL